MAGEKQKQKRKSKAAELQKQEQKPKREEIAGEISGQWKKAKLKKEYKRMAVFLAMFAAAVLGRVALQNVPSVEPIIPLAVLAGLIFGGIGGIILGAGAYITSNFFVWGLQGPWTIFQALGGGIIGAIAGGIGKVKKPRARDVVVLAVAGTVIFEVVMNIAGAFMGIGLATGLWAGLAGVLIALPLYFLTSLPFTATHLASNAVFARLFAPLLKLKEEEKNEFKVVSVSRIDSGKHSNIRMYKST